MNFQVGHGATASPVPRGASGSKMLRHLIAGLGKAPESSREAGAAGFRFWTQVHSGRYRDRGRNQARSPLCGGDGRHRAARGTGLVWNACEWLGADGRPLGVPLWTARLDSRKRLPSQLDHDS